MTLFVSILIPVYNRHDLIRETLAAALAQNYPSFEVVVYDNASTDGTWEVLTEQAAVDPRLRIFRHDSNVGPVRNWLSCLDRANGEIGKILWSDDLISEDFLARTVPYLVSPDVGFVYTAARVFEGAAAPTSGAVLYNNLQEGLNDTLVYIEGALTGTDFPFSPGCAIFRMSDLRRHLWLDVPNRVASNFSQHAIGNDLLIFLLTAALYPSFAVVHEPLAQFRAHSGSISVASAAGRLPLHYNIARAAFVERTALPKRIVRRFNAKLWIDLKRYDGSVYRLFRVADFYPTRTAKASPFAIAGMLMRQVAQMASKWARRLSQQGDGITLPQTDPWPDDRPSNLHDTRSVGPPRKVSLAVITATRNCAGLIGPLIESLRQQTDPTFAWVVADGRSTDRTLDQIQQSGLSDVRITSEPDFSIYDALNRAIRLCTSDYYLVIGADDLLEPHAIAKFRQAAIRNRAALIVAPVQTFGMLRAPMAGRRWLRGGNAITASHSVGTLIRRDLHEQLGYYSNRYVSAADMHFVLKVASDPSLQVEPVSFLAGTFSNDGLSSTDALLSLSDFYRLQIANGENTVLQSALYGLRLTRALLRRRTTSR